MVNRRVCRDDVNRICSEIVERFGSDPRKINWTRMFMKYGTFSNKANMRAGFINYINRELGVNRLFQKTTTAKIYCDLCYRTGTKLIKFKGEYLCRSCLNPESEPPGIPENSSHMGHCEYEGM